MSDRITKKYVLYTDQWYMFILFIWKGWVWCLWYIWHSSQKGQNRKKGKTGVINFFVCQTKTIKNPLNSKWQYQY